MKVLLITGIFPPDIGGPANFIPKLASKLTHDQLDVVVFTLGEKFVIEEIDGYKVLRIPRKLPRLVRSLISILIIFYLGKKATYVLANGLHEEAGIGLRLAKNINAVAKIVGDPVWERARNNSKTNLNIEEFNLLSLGFSHLLERKLLVSSLKQFSKVITPSDQLSRLVALWGFDREILTIPNGVKQNQRNEVDRVYDVVTVSRLVSWKNIDVLIEASKKYQFSLLIVGDGPDEHLLKGTANESKHIHFYGKADEQEVIDLMASSRLFALMSDYEGMSFALLQAMSMGLPVVVSAAAGNSEIVSASGNGLIIDPLTIDQVGLAINSLIESESELKRMSIASIQAVKERYSINRCLESTSKALLK
jgi:glycosyltransferase involved in cell wall biosynthesis